MSQALKAKVEELFEATKDLQSFEEMQAHCDDFNKWVSKQNYNTNSLGTKLSQAGLYKKFKSLPLEEGKNAVSTPTHDRDGNQNGTILKHYVLTECGLKEKDWKARKSEDEITYRLKNSKELDPERYLEMVGKLLASDKLHEIAVGLIAATGRRPHEILLRGSFTAIEGEEYQVEFSGQGKKRGEKPVFKISTLYPASYLIKIHNQLRSFSSLKRSIKNIESKFPKDLEAQNRSLDSLHNSRLNRIVVAFFGGDNPVLAVRGGEEIQNCKALRAAYAALATKRDCNGATGEKMLFASSLLGHTDSDKDGELKNTTTTLVYLDYNVTKSVPFPNNIAAKDKEEEEQTEKEQLKNVRVSASDLEVIKNLQKEWQLPNQQSTIAKLLELRNWGKEEEQEAKTSKKQVKELEKEIQRLEKKEEKSKVLEQEHKQLQKQVKELTQKCEELEQKLVKNEKEPAETKNPQSEEAQEKTQGEKQVKEPDLSKLLDEKLSPIISRLEELEKGKTASKPAIAPATNKETITAKDEEKQQADDTDWESLPSEELKASRDKGAVLEKIRRSFVAITRYNDESRDSNGKPNIEKMWVVNNQALRQLSGCNGLMVKEWMEAHHTAIEDHNSKYDLGKYHNRGKGDITEAISW